VSRPASYPNPALQGLRLPKGIQRANVWYQFSRRFVQMSISLLWKVRVYNRHFEPADGGVVYIGNHQSFLDPVVMSMALRRPMNFMARDTLFRFPGFKQLIGSLNSFPIRRGTADISAMKEAMRRLKAGRQIMVFAEGTRTRDGRIGPVLPGVALLAQRAAKWTVPVVIDGAFEAWPRTQALPSPGHVVIQYGHPIPQDEARKLKAQALVDHVREILIDIQTDVRRRLGRARLDYD